MSQYSEPWEIVPDPSFLILRQLTGNKHLSNCWFKLQAVENSWCLFSAAGTFRPWLSYVTVNPCCAWIWSKLIINGDNPSHSFYTHRVIIWSRGQILSQRKKALKWIAAGKIVSVLFILLFSFLLKSSLFNSLIWLFF